MFRRLLLLPLLFSFALLPARSAADADRLFQAGDYSAAADIYMQLLRRQPANALYNYRYARCAQEQGRNTLAIDHFLRAGDRYPLRDFFLGALYAEEYRFAEATEAYQRYLNTLTPDNERYAAVVDALQQARIGERLMRRVSHIEVIDSLVLPKNDFLSRYNLSPEAGTLTQDSDMVFYTGPRGDRRIYSVTAAEGSALVADTRLLDRWSQPDTLPAPVNEGSLVGYPFLSDDGITLWFASKRPGGLGGYDLWMSRYNAANDTWLLPENLGFPFNSPANDYMLAVDAVRNIGWFATDRRTSADSVCVYTFRPAVADAFLTQCTDSVLRAAARLLPGAMPALPDDSLVLADASAHTDLFPTDAVDTADLAVTLPVPQPALRPVTGLFVVCDTLVLCSATQFVSAEARDLYLQWMALSEDIDAERTVLEQYRLRYAAAAPADRSALAPVILTQERTLANLRASLSLLAADIRRLELSTRRSTLVQ